MLKFRPIILLVIVGALTIVVPTQQISAASVGGSCSKLGKLGGSAKTPLVCARVGKKLKWKALPSTTVAPVATTTTIATATTISTTTTIATGATSSNSGLAAAGICPTAYFPSLANSVGAGAAYVKPSISVTCTDSVAVITSNNMIGYSFVPLTPNALRPQNYVWRISRTPTIAPSPTLIVRNGMPTLGTLGFTTTGLAIYGPTEGPIPANTPYGDPNYNGMLDTCGGHTGPSAEYHNHVLYQVAACNLGSRAILGYAIDGFPIYGPTACLNVACTSTGTVSSGYVKTGDPARNVWSAYTYTASSNPLVLDACNGRTQPDGSYGYHAVMTFPYILGCLKGSPTVQSGAAGEPMPAMSTSAGQQASTVRANFINTQEPGELIGVYCSIRLS